MMKGKQYSRRILNKEITNNLYYFIDSKDINLKQIDYLGGNLEDDKSREKIKEDILEIVELFKNGRELGSIIKAKKDYDFEVLYNFTKNINNKDTLPMELIGIGNTQEDIIQILRLLEILSSKYNVVVTNPPYLGRGHMGVNLTKYLDKEYPDTKADLFAVFMERGLVITKNLGYTSMVTMQSWMFLSSYEKMRKQLLNNTTTVNLIHMENMVMRIAFGTAAFTIMKKDLLGYKGTYNQIKLENIKKDVPEYFPIKENRYNEVSEGNFELVPGSPISYWVSSKFALNFEQGIPLSEVASPKRGLCTCANELFYKNWYEIQHDYFLVKSNLKTSDGWIPLNKGGKYRKWYGNLLEVVDWKNNANRLRRFEKSQIKNEDYYFLPSITWSSITSSKLSFRYTGEGFIFDQASNGIFPNENYYFYFTTLLNTKLCDYILNIINPSLNILVGDIGKIPIIFSEIYKSKIDCLAQKNISISKIDWDSFETS